MDTPVPGSIMGQRRNEDIALDLMKFIAGQTEMGKGPSVGFQQRPSSATQQDHADKLLELYSRCLNVMQGKK